MGLTSDVFTGSDGGSVSCVYRHVRITTKLRSSTGTTKICVSICEDWTDEM